MQNIQWVLNNGFISLYEQRGELFKPVLFFFVLFCALTFLESMTIDDVFLVGFYNILIFLLHSLLLAFVAINVHRILLKSKRLYVEADFLLSKVDSNIRYLIRAFWIFAIVYLIIILFFLLPFFEFEVGFEQSSTVFFGFYGLLVLLSCAVFYYLSPVFLVLPCIAYQSVMTFRDAFKLGRNYRLLIFLIVIVLPTLMEIVLSGIIELLFYNPASLEKTETESVTEGKFFIIENIFYNIVYFATTVISVSFLSAAYARIKSLETIKV